MNLPYRNESHPPSVELASRQHYHPETRVAAVLLDTVAYPDRQRTRDEHGQQLQADDRDIAAAPSLIGSCIFPPQRAHRRGSVRRAVDILAVAQEEDILWEVFGSFHAGLGERAATEEALPEVAALEDEMDQGVGRVPDEEEARLVRGRGREQQAGAEVACGEDDDGREEGPDGCLADEGGSF